MLTVEQGLGELVVFDFVQEYFLRKGIHWNIQMLNDVQKIEHYWKPDLKQDEIILLYI